MTPTGYGASKYGRFGYGAIPPEGTNASNTITMLGRAYHVRKKAPGRPPRNTVIITNLGNTIITLQAVPVPRMAPKPPVRISPRRRAIIIIDDYDLGQISILRQKGFISLEILP